MEHMTDTPIEQTEQTQQEAAYQASMLFPGFAVTEDGILNVSSGEVIPDICVDFLGLNTGAKNVLYRWGMSNNRLTDGNLMLSTLLPLTSDYIKSLKNVGSKNWTVIHSAFTEYLYTGGKRPQTAARPSSANAVPSDPSEPPKEPLNDGIVFSPPDPTVPVLAEEYAVVDGRIFRRRDHVQIKDAPIDTLDLRVRGRNCLQARNIAMISQLVGMPYDNFRSTRNLGVSTANEIIEKLAAYLERPANRCDAPEIKPLPTDRIESYFKENPFGAFRKAELPKLFAGEEADDLNAALDILLESGDISFENGMYHKVYPSFFSALEEFLETAKESDRRAGKVVQLRSEGKTLEEIGQSQDVTRERVRQMEKKAFTKVAGKCDRRFAEDKFAELYKKYALEKDVLYFITDHREQTVYYLNRRYDTGSQPLENAPDDKRLSVELRRKIEKWLDRDYFFADGERIHRDRRSIEDVVLRKYCADGCSFDEFCERYNRFLLSCDLPPETAETLLISDSVKRTRTNRLAESRKLLWGRNQSLRYYDVDSVDATELLETLDLGQFDNIELSTRKFMLEYPDLMEKYDIRDEYELHNLLRKIGAENENPGIRFSKMPNIVFGEFDREQAVKELLFELAPISAEDLAEELSEKYGHRTDVVLSNWLPYIWDYYHQGLFTVDVKEMPNEHMALLKEDLTDSFYFFGDIKKRYRELLPDADVSLISRFNLRRMGFRVNSDYVIQGFDSAEAYFRDLLTCTEIVDASRFHDRFKNISAYWQTLKELKHDYTIIEFEPMQYINRSRLQRSGITEQQFKDYCDEVYAFVGETSYFTMESLRYRGFTSPLDDLGFGTQFYSSLLREDVRFTNWHIGHNILFYAGDIHMKRSKSGNNYVSIKAFVSDYLEKVKSTDIDEMLSVFEDEYNIRLDRRTIIEECKDTSLYYDRIMEKLYINYDAYFEEI